MHRDNKRAYPTPGRAALACEGCVSRGAGYLRVYHCPQCGLYHLTNRKPEEMAPRIGGWGVPPPAVGAWVNRLKKMKP